MEREAFVQKRLLLENTDRHLGERKETSRGILRVEGPERRRRRKTQEEEGGEELKRRGVDERGKGGLERGRERQIQRSTDSGEVQSAACRLATDAARGLNTHAQTHTPLRSVWDMPRLQSMDTHTLAGHQRGNTADPRAWGAMESSMFFGEFVSIHVCIVFTCIWLLLCVCVRADSGTWAYMCAFSLVLEAISMNRRKCWFPFKEKCMKLHTLETCFL